MLLRSFAIALTTLTLMSTADAHASPIVYTLAGTFSGTLGSTQFTNDAGLFTFYGDSTGITNLGGGFYTNTTGMSTLTLAGIGQADFTGLGVESEFNAAAFYDIPSGFALGIYNEGIGSYDLSAPYGPVSGSFVGSTGVSEATNLGALVITSEAGTGTFTATNTTPEPSSLLLLGTGLCVAAALWRRRVTVAHSSL